MITPSRILVSRTDRMGDVLLATPVLTAIKKKFPNCFLVMLVNTYTKEIIEGNPNVDEIIIYEPKETVSSLTEKLKSCKFDTAVILYPRWYIALACYLAGIKNRIGVGYRWYSFLLNKRVYIHRSKVEKHELEYNFDLLELLDIKMQREMPFIVYGEKEKQFAKKILENNKIKLSDKIIAMHPDSGKSAENWSTQNYAKLADALQNKGFKLVVSGTKSDKTIADEMISQMNAKPPILLGETSIKQLAALLEYCKLFISSSTGPMHLAATVGTPTLSFFPNARVRSPKRWGPWGNKHIVLQPKDDNMNSILVDQALKSAISLLS